jgi:hypothetical protein
MFEVYIHEAHAGENNSQYPEFAQFDQPTTLEERIEIFEFYRAYIPSKPLVNGDTIIIPALIDYIDGEWENKYSRMPTTGWVIGFDGTIKENTGFLTNSRQLDNMDDAIADELATAIHTSKNKTEYLSITPYQVTKNKILINGLNGKEASYSLFQLNGTLLQNGTIKSSTSFINLEKEYTPGIYVLKLKGAMNSSTPVMLK